MNTQLLLMLGAPLVVAGAIVMLLGRDEGARKQRAERQRRKALFLADGAVPWSVDSEDDDHVTLAGRAHGRLVELRLGRFNAMLHARVERMPLLPGEQVTLASFGRGAEDEALAVAEDSAAHLGEDRGWVLWCERGAGARREALPEALLAWLATDEALRAARPQVSLDDWGTATYAPPEPDETFARRLETLCLVAGELDKALAKSGGA